MKKSTILLLIILFSNTSQAQYMLEKGDAQINAGLGFSTWGIPVYVGLDYGVHKDISIGGEFSYRSYTTYGWDNHYYNAWNYHHNYGWNYHSYHHNIFGFSANGNYHFNTILKIPKEFDFYAGINIGFYAWTYPNDYYGDRVSGLGIGAQIGGRYYINDNFGINLEFGGGNAFGGGKFGISYKF